MTAFDKTKLTILLNDAKAKHQEAAEATEKVYEEINRIAGYKTVDLDAPTGAENAGTLEEAINCYIAYGEYTAGGLIAEIEEAIKNAE